MYNRSLHIFFIAAFLCLSIAVNAQISITPLEYNPAVANAKYEKIMQRKSVSLDTLPFVEDFASAGPFPSTERWVDNHVFVNATMADNPPSIGVATFDGLDNTGSPYKSNGAGDTLTSVGINLDLPNANNLFLSYFIQRRGFGDQPEAADSLILEFKSDLDEWIQIRSYTGRDGILPDSLGEFMFETVQIAALGYLFDDFQFRFRNTSSGNGFVDLWHLDVIKIVNNQVPSQTYQDLAFQFPTQSLLDRYSAMPTKHFLDDPSSHLRETFTFSIFNHLDVARPIGSDGSNFSVTEKTTSLEVLAPNQYLTATTDLNIDADTIKIIQASPDFNINANGFNDQDDLIFETLFTIDPNPNDNDPGLLDNNFLRRATIMSDYFAYDDGTAERNIQARGAGTQIAVEYQTTVADTVSAIQIMMPHIIGDVSNQFFNLKVWVGDLNNDPSFEGQLLNTIYVDSFVDTIQGLTTYRLEDTFTGELQPVPIDANTKFYVGWEQVTVEYEDAIPVGFDISTTDVNQYQFFKTSSGDWMSFENENFIGAIMIRPVMGVENAIFTAVENKKEQKINIYPNPSNGQIKIESNSSQNLSAFIDVFDVQGRLVHNQAFQENIDLSFLAAGVYFINLKDNTDTVLVREKLIIQ